MNNMKVTRINKGIYDIEVGSRKFTAEDCLANGSSMCREWVLMEVHEYSTEYCNHFGSLASCKHAAQQIVNENL